MPLFRTLSDGLGDDVAPARALLWGRRAGPERGTVGAAQRHGAFYHLMDHEPIETDRPVMVA